jgi:hypothetical protein
VRNAGVDNKEGFHTDWRKLAKKGASCRKKSWPEEDISYNSSPSGINTHRYKILSAETLGIPPQ